MKWDYITANIDRSQVRDLENLLDIYGRQGWELVVIWNDSKLIFKKPLNETQKAQKGGK